MKSFGFSTLCLLVILAGFGVYAGLFIERTSFGIEGERHFALFDDAMISMQYAKNLAAGDGAVWNPGGERIEGFSNPLWMLVMAALHWLPVGLAKTSLLVQILGAALLALNLVFVYKLARLISKGSALVALSAVLMTALYYPLNYWGLTGNEVSVVTCITTFAAWKILRGIKHKTFSVWPYVALAAAFLVRMDMAIPFMGMAAFASFVDRENRLRHFAWSAGIFIAAYALQTGVRFAYYGEVLPNTYHLKLTGYSTGWRVARGLVVFVEFVWQFNWVLFLVPFVFVAMTRSARTMLLLGLFCLQCAYSIWVGGDAWEGQAGANRYLSVAMPLFFVLFGGGVAAAVHGGITRMGASPSPSNTAAVLFAVVLACSCTVNAIFGPRALKSVALIDAPLYTEHNETNVRLGLAIREMTEPGAKVAVLWAGTLPYFADRFAIDVLGKNDLKIARQKARVPDGPSGFRSFVPGHTKWDYAYAVGELEPDVVVGLIPGFEDEGLRYLEPGYRMVTFRRARVFLREGSEDIKWDELDRVLARYDSP